jgi:SpoVK/Ycf46/Vps4 family AAA+-type ATPase
LENHATVIEWPMPDRLEIGQLLDAAVKPHVEQRKIRALTADNRELAVEAAIGLSGEEVQACFARSLVQFKKIDPVAIANEKKRVVSREGVIEWYDPLKEGLAAVGGLENIKEWLTERKLAYTPEAKQYGLRAPKGMMLVGVPGCGKSLVAKAVSTAWGMPLLRVDLGGMKGKFLGESEGNLRRAIQLIEAIGRCVVWIDEIEKALAGATQGAADGGVSADALGTLLSWMQERKGESFVIATANDVTSLPPELMRQGRFDTIFFVDLPNASERSEVLKASFKANGQSLEVLSIDLDKIVAATEGFAGVEVFELVPSAMFTAFADGGREVRTEDLVSIAKKTTPLSKTSETRIKALREWAVGKARPATKEEVTRRRTASTDNARAVELED